MSVDEALRTNLERLEDQVLIPDDALVKVNPQIAEKAIEREGNFYENELRRLTLADIESARKQREKYAHRIFLLVCVWVALIYILLVFQGFGWFHYRPLSDAVLIALVSSTTVNLIGTLIIVLNYIFRVPSSIPTAPQPPR
jgi:hypothetical protein